MKNNKSAMIRLAITTLRDDPDTPTVILSNMRHTDRATVYRAASEAGIEVTTNYNDEERTIAIEVSTPKEDVIEMLTGQAAIEAKQRIFGNKVETRGRNPRPSDEMTQKERDAQEWKRILCIDPQARSEPEHEFMEYIHNSYAPHELH